MNKIIRLSMIFATLFILPACAPSVPTATPTIVPTLAPTLTPMLAPTLAPTLTPTISPTSMPTFTPTSAAPPRSVANHEFDASRAMEHNRVLAVTIGTRVAGSDNATRAGDYIAQQFASYGYVIETQSFAFENWQDLGTRVQITAPDARTLDARPMQFSSPGKVEAELVAVGTGTESEFSKLNVRGNIVLVQRSGILFSDAARNAERAGAVATIVYNNAPERFAGALRDKTANPVLAISGRDGQTLLDLLSKGAVKIKIESDTAIRQVMARNIIATKRGATDSVVIMGAHYDSVEEGTGANDNGSGASVLLELARAMSQKSYKPTLVFVAFDAEELGLIGSRHYVTSLVDDARKRIVAMLNFDMLGGGSGPLLFDGDGRVGKLALDAAKELGIDARSFSLGSGASSDHSSFRSVGIDAVFFMREYNLLHTPQDTIEQVRAEWLGEAGRVAMKMVEKLE